MSKSPWGKIGAWAAEAERAEAEEREAAEQAAAAQPPPLSFPSLKESTATASKQTKKKTKMTLQEFNSGGGGSQSQSQSQSQSRAGLTHEEMLRLPTGPKERSPDEMVPRLGGGFSNYGSRPGSNPGRGRSSYGGGFDEDDRRMGPQSRVSEPSRADGVDNWASLKKNVPGPDYNSGPTRPAGGGGKYGSLGGGRADEVDNWASLKKPVAAAEGRSYSGGFGSGFSRQEGDRWGRNEGSRPEGDTWVRSEDKSEVVVVVEKVNKPNPFGAARPREEVLAEKGLDWKKLDLEIEGKKSGSSRPTSSHSSRPGSAHSSRSSEVPPAAGGVGDAGEAMRQRPKVNPFGDAKPREVLLEQKGLDWKKIDLELEHRRVERPKTEEEKNLEEEIEQLRKGLLESSGEEQNTINELILQKGRDLELLTRQLDDKVRYSQKNFERPGSGAGRGAAGVHDRPPSRPGAYEDPRAGYGERPPSRPGAYEARRPGSAERPHSRPGAYEESRAIYPQRSSSFIHKPYQEPRAFDYNERPGSRGTVSSWSRPSDDRRTYQGGGGRGFSGGRDMDRSASRW